MTAFEIRVDDDAGEPVVFCVDFAGDMVTLEVREGVHPGEEAQSERSASVAVSTTEAELRALAAMLLAAADYARARP